MAQVQKNEVAATDQETAQPPVSENSKNPTTGLAKITLDEYQKQHGVHIGLIASYRYEALERPELLQDKTDAEWTSALQEQSKKHY